MCGPGGDGFGGSAADFSSALGGSPSTSTNSSGSGGPGAPSTAGDRRGTTGRDMANVGFDSGGNTVSVFGGRITTTDPYGNTIGDRTIGYNDHLSGGVFGPGGPLAGTRDWNAGLGTTIDGVKHKGWTSPLSAIAGRAPTGPTVTGVPLDLMSQRYVSPMPEAVEVGLVPGMSDYFSDVEDNRAAGFSAFGGDNLGDMAYGIAAEDAVFGAKLEAALESDNPDLAVADLVDSYLGGSRAQGIISADDFGSKIASWAGWASPVSFNPNTQAFEEDTDFNPMKSGLIDTAVRVGLGPIGAALVGAKDLGVQLSEGDYVSAALNALGAVDPTGLLDLGTGMYSAADAFGIVDGDLGESFNEAVADYMDTGETTALASLVTPSSTSPTYGVTPASYGDSGGGDTYISTTPILTAATPVAAEHYNPYTSVMVDPNATGALGDLSKFAGGILNT